MKYYKFKDMSMVPGVGRVWPKPIEMLLASGKAQIFDDVDDNSKGWIKIISDDNIDFSSVTSLDAGDIDGSIRWKQKEIDDDKARLDHFQDDLDEKFASLQLLQDDVDIRKDLIKPKVVEL